MYCVSLDSQLITQSIDIIDGKVWGKIQGDICHELETHHFSSIFFQHGYLSYSLICVRHWLPIDEICPEERNSQSIDEGLSFCFM